MLIQKIHRYVANPLAIIPLCLLILSITTYSANANPLPATVNYSAEELFRGIYFAQGPVAEQIPIIKSFDIHRFVKDKNRLHEITDFQERVIARVKQDHSDFLQELKASVDSKNHYKIKATLIKGNEIMLNISAALAGQSRDLETEAALKAELNKRVDLATASGEEISAALETMAADVIVSVIVSDVVTNAVRDVDVLLDSWILLPFCIIAFCWVVIYIGAMEMHPEGLFQEQLVSAIAKL